MTHSTLPPSGTRYPRELRPPESGNRYPPALDYPSPARTAGPGVEPGQVPDLERGEGAQAGGPAAPAGRSAQAEPLAPAPGVKHKLAAVAYNSGEAFATSAVSWGLRSAMMSGFATAALELIDLVRADYGMGPLKEDPVLHASTVAVIAAIASNAAAPVLGAVNGAAINMTQMLRQVVNVAHRSCQPAPVDGKAPPPMQPAVLQNITSPRFKVLCDNLVTAGFTMMAIGNGLHRALQPDAVPSNMQFGSITAESAFNAHASALGSAIVGGGAYLVAALVTVLADGDLRLAEPKPLTLGDAQSRVHARALAARDAFTGPVIGLRGAMSVPVLLAVSSLAAGLLKAHEDSVDPWLAGLLNGGLAGAAFFTIADQWGARKVVHEMPSGAVALSAASAPRDQKAQWVSLAKDHREHQLERWTERSAVTWFCDQTVATAHAAVSAAALSAYLGTVDTEAIGSSEGGSSETAWFSGMGMTFALAGLVTYAIGRCELEPQPAPVDIREELATRGERVGPDRDRSWTDGMMPSLVEGVLIGTAVLGGAIPVGTAIGLSAFAATTTAAVRLFQQVRNSAARNEMVAMDDGAQDDVPAASASASASADDAGAAAALAVAQVIDPPLQWRAAEALPGTGGAPPLGGDLAVPAGAAGAAHSGNAARAAAARGPLVTIHPDVGAPGAGSGPGSGWVDALGVEAGRAPMDVAADDPRDTRFGLRAAPD